MTKDLREILVVSDMDGTLLAPDTQLLGCNIECIRLFKKLGGHFTVATGRTIESVAMYPELVKLIDPAITGNGGVLYDYGVNATLVSENLPRAVAKLAVKDILQAFPRIGVIVFVPDSLPYIINPAPRAQQLFDDENISFLVRPFEELPRDWNKVIFAGEPEELAAVQEFVEGRSYPGSYFISSSPIYFELMPEGVNKGSALLKLCKITGISLENTIVIGDYYNDLTMMEQAGRAVAMANAPDEILMKAHEVTGSNENGGVGQYLYKLIKELA